MKVLSRGKPNWNITRHGRARVGTGRRTEAAGNLQAMRAVSPQKGESELQPAMNDAALSRGHQRRRWFFGRAMLDDLEAVDAAEEGPRRRRRFFHGRAAYRRQNRGIRRRTVVLPTRAGVRRPATAPAGRRRRFSTARAALCTGAEIAVLRNATATCLLGVRGFFVP